MQPNFALTGDAALQQIAPVTQARQEQALSAVAASLGLSAFVGPFKAPASGASVATLPSSLPSAQPPAGTPAGGSLPAPITNFTPGLDPILKYQAGNALFQFVQLLNSELSSRTIRDKHTPFIARIRVAVLPYQSALPYDVYAYVSFFTGDTHKCDLQALCAPIVLPLLVTDDIERATDAAAAETARQLAFALSVNAPCRH
jgi:hypothetical protein